MLRPRIIPCLLIHQGGLVKTRKFKEPKYVGDPINAVKIFNEKESDELMVLDIDATVNKAQGLRRPALIEIRVVDPARVPGSRVDADDLMKPGRHIQVPVQHRGDAAADDSGRGVLFCALACRVGRAHVAR